MRSAIKLMAGMLLMLAIPVSLFASEEAQETCKEAANRISDVITDWHQLVKEVGAEAKNPSVMKMYADHTNNHLKENFVKKCVNTWSLHQEVYACFAGVRSEIGAAMCNHPDTNKNNWDY